MKRAFDVTVACVGLVPLAPLLFLIALLIKVDSLGPIFFRQERIGKGVRPFLIYKFRTMVHDASQRGRLITVGADPRITRMGRILRKTNLDELPQLINVLKGEMSLVGPRPEIQHYVSMYTEEERAILTVRPGITDWASLWDFDEGAILAGSPDPEKMYREKILPEKIRLQLTYVRNRSLWIDLAILLQTLVAVVFRVRPRTVGITEKKVTVRGRNGEELK